MTGLQARHPKMPSDQDCAGKHGDDDNLVKAQVFSTPPRPPPLLSLSILPISNGGCFAYVSVFCNTVLHVSEHCLAYLFFFP